MSAVFSSWLSGRVIRDPVWQRPESFEFLFYTVINTYVMYVFYKLGYLHNIILFSAAKLNKNMESHLRLNI